MRRRPLLAAASILAIAAATQAAGAAGHRVFVERTILGGRLAYRPHEIVLSSDATFSVGRIRWLRYGGPVAVGAGVAYARSCRPDCAEGRVFRPRARLRLTRVIRCQRRYVYAQLSFALHGRIPPGYRRRGSYSLRPRGQSGGPAC